jgi:hypothetical protein
MKSNNYHLKVIAILIVLLLIPFNAMNQKIGKGFIKSAISQIPNLAVARYKTPPFKAFTLGGALAGFALFGAAGTQMSFLLGAPETSDDYGEIIMYKFLDRALKEIPTWPKMSLIKTPVKIGYKDKSWPTLIFEVQGWLLHSKGGFMSTTSVTMLEPDGRILWKKKYMYWGKKNGRFHSVKEFKADPKLLSDEVDFAANTTVSAFINDFNGIE